MADIVWNAGAHNENLGSGTGGDSLRVSGTIPQGVTGAVIGLTAEPQVTRPAQILHGIQVSAGRYRAVEIGSAKTGWHDAPDPMARYHVTRLSDRVIYSVETESGGEADITTTGVPVPGLIFHESDYIGPEYSEGAASLLSPGDSVINGEAVPVLVAGLEMSFQPLEVVAANGASARSVFEAMQVSSGAYRSGEATVAFEPMMVESMLAGDGYAFATVSFKPMQVSASIAGELSVGDGVTAVMQPCEMLAVGSRWIEPSAEVTFVAPAVGAYQDSAYAGAFAELEPMLTYSSGQRVPTGVRLGIILPAITHEVFLGTKVVEYGFAFNECEHASARNLIDTVLVSDEFIVLRSDRWTEDGAASDALQHSTVERVESAADALDAYSHKSLQPGVTELATADNTIAHYSDITLALTSTATASDTTVSTDYAMVTEDAQASIELQAVTAQTVETEAQAESAVEIIRLDDGTLVEATAFGFTDLDHWRQSVMLVGEFAEVFSDYLHQDPNAIAWVLNPETAALSNYTNHPITGIAGAFMIGPEGLMRIDNDSDNGDDISALIDLPGLTLGRPDRQGQVSRSPERKRVEAVWLDADSQTEMAVGVRSYDQGGEPFHYKSLRPLDDTGNMKVSVGKGLKSKWWGITIRNTYGGDFTLSGASADVAATARWR